MQHTFLWQEGEWKAHGVLMDESGERMAVSGKAVIRHGPAGWRNESEMRVLGASPWTLRQEYLFVPAGPRKTEAEWTAVSAAHGGFHGVAAIVGDTILSQGESQDGRERVAECLRMVAAGKYENRGVHWRGGVRARAWELELERV